MGRLSHPVSGTIGGLEPPTAVKNKINISPRVSTFHAIEPLESRIAPAFAGVLAGAAATLTGDGASDTLVLTAIGGFLSHNRFAAHDPGFASAFDFDSVTPGVQKLAADAGSTVAIDLGTGTDTVLLGGDHHAANLKAKFTIHNADATGDVLDINDSAGTAPVALTVNTTQVTGSGFNIEQLGNAFDTLALRTGAGADVITVPAVSTRVTLIDSGAGNDIVTSGNGVQQTL